MIPTVQLVQIESAARERPHFPPFHLFQSGLGAHLLVLEGSQVYDLDRAAAAEIGSALAHGTRELVYLGAGSFLGDVSTRPRFPASKAPEPPPLRSLSLNLAQSCNLACNYCYAEGGSFGSPEAFMDRETARRSVDLLLNGGAPGVPVVVG